MNRTVILDKIWKAYSCLPHCQIVSIFKRKRSRQRFDYEKNSDISIISTNCIGGEIYSILGLPFSSPLINTSMNRKQFIKLCGNLREYIDTDLKVKMGEDGRPIGNLGNNELDNIEIHFDHDDNLQEVLDKWDRRRHRINWNKIVIICDDKDIDEEDYELFDKIDAYRKIMLTAADRTDKYSWSFPLKPYKKKERTGDYNGKSLKGGWKFQYMWDFIGFINQ